MNTLISYKNYSYELAKEANEGEITGHNYFFEGFRPVCELYDTAEDALAAHNYKKENYEMDIDNTWI